MANMTTRLEEKLIEHTLLNLPYSSPGTVYVALLTDNPTAEQLEAGDLTNEITGGGYARQAVNFSDINDSTVENDADIDFPQATADWGNVTHIYITETSTGDDAIYYQELVNPREILTDDIFRITASNLSVELD